MGKVGRGPEASPQLPGYDPIEESADNEKSCYQKARRSTGTRMKRGELEQIYWAVQERSTALELVIGQLVLTYAATLPAPFDWTHGLVTEMRKSLKEVGIDRMTDVEARQLEDALREYLNAASSRQKPPRDDGS